jgi:universal stress protein A
MARRLLGRRPETNVFRHILVPIDLSRKNERALRTAAEIARQSGGRLTMLHVIQRVEHIPLDEIRPFYLRLERMARSAIARAAKRAARNLAVQGAVLVGTPAEDIVRYAAENRVDLIVLSSHRLTPGRPHPGWATTSYKVGILCQCPVLLVK